jgi:hypothetical protein
VECLLFWLIKGAFIEDTYRGKKNAWNMTNANELGNGSSIKRGVIKVREPAALKSVKQEIDKAAGNPIHIGLTKISIYTSDAIWLVRQVELLQRIAKAFRNNSRSAVFQPYSTKEIESQYKKSGGNDYE